MWIAIVSLAVLLVGKIQQVNRLEDKLSSIYPQQELVEYYKVTEQLLEDLEHIDNLNGIEWGDTICEGDSWEAYEIVKSKLNN